jgi:Tol biopolymer transport system component
MGESRVVTMIGQTLSHYRITEKLGAGGMGEVYKARDTTLGRDVAIKVLPETFAKDAQRTARFEREARLLASLNHPAIATIHGFETAENVSFLVMELVEGETLAERSEKGAVKLQDALPIARQMAEGLEAAHERGIAHRDLKPANVKVTTEGDVKILDFGLAKAFEEDTPGGIDSDSPTLTRAATQAGVLLGTAAYMSPEQARGQRADRRSDIWAFGVVLWEMLTGHLLFAGATASETLAAVLRDELDWKELPSGTPAPIRELLRRCLNRDWKKRLQAIGEARVTIEEYLADPAASSSVTAVGVAGPVPVWQRSLPWIACVLVLALFVSVWGWWRAAQPLEKAPVRFPVEISPGTSLSSLRPVLSPDGEILAYTAEKEGVRRLYIRHLDRLEEKLLSGTENAQLPFFSPDGQWIGFFAGGRYKKVSVAGGTPVVLCDAPFPFGATWGVNDTIVFGTFSRGLLSVPATGGVPEEMAMASEGDASHVSPHFLPEGRGLLFVSLPLLSSLSEANIEVLDLESGEQKLVYRGGFAPSYLPTGHIAFVAEDTLFIAPFDLDRLEMTGTPVPAIDDIRYSSDGRVSYTFSTSGALLYGSGGRQETTLAPVWVDRRGNTSPLPIAAADYWEPALSPDGAQLALQRHDEGADIWIYDFTRETFSPLTFFEGFDGWPVWFPDGRSITYNSSRSGKTKLYRKRADGSRDEEQLTDDLGKNCWPDSWSPNGDTLIFTVVRDNLDDLWTLSLDENGKPTPPQPYLETPFMERDAKFSPDGRWLAYVSDESGRFEVYVRSFEKGEGTWQVSTEGGLHPTWSRNSPELFFRNGDTMMVVDYSVTDEAFRAAPPRELFTVPTLDDLTHSTYDVTADGERFIVLLPEEHDASSAADHAILVLNWFDEVRRLGPKN